MVVVSISEAMNEYLESKNIETIYEYILDHPISRAKPDKSTLYEY